MDPKAVIEALQGTGFPLEHKTAEVFRSHGWAIITNKYYLEDRSGEAREIDIIAYKTKQIGRLLYYSAVIVSCKKKNGNAWAFLTRTAALENKNVDWFPVHTWTNDSALKHQFNEREFGKNLVQKIELCAPTIWRSPSRAVFAFQELAPQPGGRVVAKNDSSIYGSLASLMKAQAYEVSRLDRRKSTKAAYIFTLLSVHEGQMFDVRYDSACPKVEDCEFREHIAHYIIGREEQFSRVNFVNIACLERIVSELDEAHNKLSEEVQEQWDNFYKDVMKSKERIAVFGDTFKRRLHLFAKRFHPKPEKFSPSDIEVSYNEKLNMVEIGFSDVDDERVIQAMNEDSHLGFMATAILKQVYKYDGEFRFVTDDSPF
jgi:hypothetical protein